MTKEHHNYLKMTFVVNKFLIEHHEIIATIPAILNTQYEIEYYQNLIKNPSNGEQIHSVTLTKTKNEARKRLSDRIIQIAGSIEAYAMTRKDLELLNTHKTSHNKLNRLTEQALLSHATNLLAAATQIQPTLTDYGLTTEILQNLENRIETYKNLIQKAQNLSLHQSATKNEKKQNLTALRSAFHKLDRLMLNLSENHPQIYETYQNYRKNPKLGKRYNRLIIQVESQTYRNLSHFTLSLTNPKRSYTAPVKPDGNAEFTSPATGKYTLFLHTPDKEETPVVEITIKRGKKVTLSLNLDNVKDK